tara:strand:+ start:437 stop:1366 length:930 start_codon:yes stop_codon:yes gene_type:complete
MTDEKLKFTIRLVDQNEQVLKRASLSEEDYNIFNNVIKSDPSIQNLAQLMDKVSRKIWKKQNYDPPKTIFEPETLAKTLDAEIKFIIDAKLQKLFSKIKPVDPGLGKNLTYWHLWLHGASIAQGQILEDIVLRVVKNKLSNCMVWEDKEFPISQRALTISADQNNQNKNDVLEVLLPYPGNDATQKIQIDMMIYNPEDKSLSSFEIKRGWGVHDRQKKQKIVSDLLNTHMHLKSYGIAKHKLDVKKTNTFVLSVLGKELMPPKWRNFSINGMKELDNYLHTNISDDVQNSLNYFISSLEDHVKNYKIPN